jgi:hypothetical protein
LLRIISYTLLIVFFNAWSAGIFIVIVLATVIMVLRFDNDKRQEFSLSTTVMMSLFAPCAISKCPHQRQIKSKTKKNLKNTELGNMLAGYITSVTIPITIAFDLLLLVILNYVPDFKTSDDILIPKEMAIMLIAFFLLPVGLCCFFAGFSLRVGNLKKRHYVAPALSLVILVISTSSVIALNALGKYNFDVSEILVHNTIFLCYTIYF